MKKIILSSLIGLVLVSSLSFGKGVEQTICFTKLGILSVTEKLEGYQCNGKTLIEMNKSGWRLVQIISGLSYSFGMLFEKVK